MKTIENEMAPKSSYDAGNAIFFKNASLSFFGEFAVYKTTRCRYSPELIRGFRLSFYVKEERAIAIMFILLNCFFLLLCSYCSLL